VAPLTLLVNEEGVVHCNGVAAGKLDDPQLLKARDLQEALHDPSSKHLSLPAQPQSAFRYHVRDESGSVRCSVTIGVDELILGKQPAASRG